MKDNSESKNEDKSFFRVPTEPYDTRNARLAELWSAFFGSKEAFNVRVSQESDAQIIGSATRLSQECLKAIGSFPILNKIARTNLQKAVVNCSPSRDGHAIEIHGEEIHFYKNDVAVSEVIHHVARAFGRALFDQLPTTLLHQYSTNCRKGQNPRNDFAEIFQMAASESHDCLNAILSQNESRKEAEHRIGIVHYAIQNFAVWRSKASRSVPQEVLPADFPLLIYIDPGNASKQTIQCVLESLSDLHRAAGGLGLEFTADGAMVFASEGVVQ